MSERILVTGGTGTTGSRVARRLAEHGIAVAVATRRPSADHEVAFDWADPASAAAFDGVRAAYLVAPTDRTDHLALMRPILERAMAAGTRRFVLLSSSQLAPGGNMMGEIHAWLAENAPEWAVLRPSWFMQNFSTGPHGRTIREESAIYSATDTGRVGFVSADDIAAAAVAALTGERSLDGDAVLTGPEALSYDDVARLVSHLLSRPVRHVRLGTEDLVRRHMALGLPRSYAEALAQLDEVIRGGGEDRTTDQVLRLTGREPTSFRMFAEGSLSSW
ncbi:ergot alkaloid biosynthesis protein [Salinarimonas ramus]|uniref:Oxidoreductase n=1 Tax=Salinarimonas ramus TaxID=690164 RepID=A0A917QLZ5_9HYPH|nr:ergot alkaloid biosynthesis protein [Salinarimonas ramus]GGK55665.1 oxidoreductase [Salinarimonas ramus]